MALIRKLHGSVDCFATQRVMASLFEHQLEFQFVPVDLKAANNPYLLSLNPFGEIPVFEDGDVTLFESTAAMRFIAHEYATQAIQQVYMTPLTQGVAATWIDVENHQFREPAVRLIEAIRARVGRDSSSRAGPTWPVGALACYRGPRGLESSKWLPPTPQFDILSEL
ncbi:hypothetical protein V2J09_016123 [Rumex salicifolius]